MVLPAYYLIQVLFYYSRSL